MGAVAHFMGKRVFLASRRRSVNEDRGKCEGFRDPEFGASGPLSEAPPTPGKRISAVGGEKGKFATKLFSVEEQATGAAAESAGAGEIDGGRAAWVE